MRTKYDICRRAETGELYTSAGCPMHLGLLKVMQASGGYGGHLSFDAGVWKCTIYDFGPAVIYSGEGATIEECLQNLVGHGWCENRPLNLPRFSVNTSV